MSTRLLLSLVLLSPSAVYAEVMDKEFSFWTVLLWTVLGVLAVFCSARYKPLVLAGVAPILIGFFALHLPELVDPSVAPAIRSEAGLLYVLISWTASVLLCGALIAGLILRGRRARSDRRFESDAIRRSPHGAPQPRR